MINRSRWKVLLLGAAASFAVTAFVFACGSDNGTGSGACQGPSCDGGGAETSTVDGPGTDTSVTDGGGSDADSSLPIVCNEGGAGTLDPTFGDGGMVWLKFTGSDSANAVAVQPDGKILVGGSTDGSNPNFALVRLLPNGTPDPSFGVNGLVVRTVGDRNAVIEALAVLPDSRIVAAGSTKFNGKPFAFTVLRYLTDGGADPSFGDGGVVITSFGVSKDAYAASLAVQPDGRVDDGGEAENAVSSVGTGDYAVARYNADGSLDNAFGSGGLALVDIHGTRDAPGVIALGGGGKIVIAGGSSSTGDDPIHIDVTAARLDSTGTLDPAFGDAGRFTTSFGGRQSAFAIRIDPTDRIVLGGQNGTGSDFGMFRLTTAGALDPSFGDGGAVSKDFAGAYDAVTALLLQPDGRLLALGLSSLGSSTSNIAAARFLPGGALDPTFGTGGTTLTPPPPNADISAAAAVLSGCTFIAVGSWSYNNNTLSSTAMGIARYRR